MNLVQIEARDLSEAWFLCLRECMARGRVYEITRGSFVGSRRRELDSVTLAVKHPSVRPLVPDVPIGVPAPCSMDYVESYLPYLMTSAKAPNELYTYGEDIEFQLPEFIRILREAGDGTNQACMNVGDKGSIFLEHSQCLRIIDARVRGGQLCFYTYFRSWDLWAGFPANLAALQLLKEYVAGEVGVDDGELVAYSKGLHVYEYCWELALRVLGREA